jgi:hypothetical protein
VLSQGTLVTLHFKKAAPRDVYAALFKQANIPLNTRGLDMFALVAGVDDVPKVTIDVDRVPFWTAMVELERQTGLFFERFGGDFQLTDTGIDARVDQAIVRGPFLLAPSDRMHGSGGIHGVQLFVEPCIGVLGVGEVAVETAIDIDGDPLPEPDDPRLQRRRHARAQAGEWDTPPFGGSVVGVSFPRPVPRAGYVKGRFPLKLVLGERTVVIPDVDKAKDAEHVFGGRRFVVDTTNPQPRVWVVTLRVTNDAALPFGRDDYRPALLAEGENPLTLRSGGEQRAGAAASVFRLLTMGSAGRGRNDVDYMYAFEQPPNVGPPTKMTLVIPNEPRVIEVPFEFGRTAAAPPQATR